MENDNRDAGRISPHSIEAEEAVLGCMLINKAAVSKVIEGLDKSSFYSNPNSIIFDSIVDLFDENKNIDYISLIDSLKRKKELKAVGGAYYVTGLSKNAPSAENVEYYMQIVKEKSILRNIINVASRRGAFGVEEFVEIGKIFTKLDNFLKEQAKILETQGAIEGDVLEGQQEDIEKVD